MGFEVFTMVEAAKKVRVSRRHLDLQIRLGVGPAVTQIGRRRFVRSDALEAWLKNVTHDKPADQARAA